VVCGCLPSIQTGELNGLVENVCLIRHRDELAGSLSRIEAGEVSISDSKELPSCQNNTIKTKYFDNFNCKNNLAPLAVLPSLTSFKGHTRAFLKIQDGCDGRCSYCIVPKTRPFVHSKPIDSVLQEAHALVASGHKEIVITGVFLGAYGEDTVRRKNWPNQQNDNLANLLDKITQIPGLARIRLSSLEPGDVTQRLVNSFCTHRNIMPHLHLSLQSGSNSILKKMCRQYTAEDFREKVSLIKSRLDRPAITTDIIVGFPGETDEDFEKTVNLAEEIGFAKMHVFRFSPRKGTVAAKMPDRVDNQVIKRRSEILRELDIELRRKFRELFIGESANILIESYNSSPSGRCERYFMVDIRQKDISDLKFQIRNNDLVKVRLIRNSNSSMAVLGIPVGGRIEGS